MKSTRFTETMILAVAILGTGMVFLDQTAINVALPAIQQSLNADVGGLQWILDIYLLTLSVLLLIGGVLGDIYGRIRIYTIGMIVFVIGSFLCGIAPTTAFLIGGRFVQGLGGAVMVPGSLAVINAAVDPERRGRALGTWATFTPMITIAGPIVGGWLVDNVSWRAVFFLNIPLGLVAILIAARWVPESRDEEIDPRLDWLGVLTLMFGLGGLLFSIIEGPHLGWTSPLITFTIIVGLIGSIAFVITEQRVPSPLLPLRLLRNKKFSGVNLMTIVLFAGFGGPFFFLSLNLQQAQGYTATAAGLASLPIAISIVLLSQRVGQLADRIGAFPILVVGVLFMATGFLLLMRPGLDDSYWTAWFPAILIYGIGLGGMVVPLTKLAFDVLPQRQSGIASGVNNAASRIGQMISIAVFGALMVTGFRNALLIRTSTIGLDVGAREALVAQARRLGELAAPTGLSADLTASVDYAIRLAFVDGFRQVMLLSALLVLSSLIILFAMVRQKPEQEQNVILAPSVESETSLD